MINFHTPSRDFPDPKIDGGELKSVFSFPIEIQLS